MLNTKQRAYLRGLANPLDPILHIGKSGIGEALVQQADDALKAREIVKGTVMENCPVSAAQAMEQLCVTLRAEPVQSIGRRFVLYRKNHDAPRIKLPN